MKVKLATTDSDLLRAGRVLVQLRTAFDLQTLVAQIRSQYAHGYRVVFVEENSQVLCVAGYVVGHKLAWGKHIYIDDLVTATAYRSRGAGRFLIDWFKEHAREIGCAQIHLDSGVQRERAHRFYEREGFVFTSRHFSIVGIGEQ